MKGQRTEAASAKASSIADQGEFDLPDGRNASVLLIGRMIRPHIGQIINIIHLLHRERRLRRILHDIDAVRIRLDQRLSRKWICVLILDAETLGIFRALLFH